MSIADFEFTAREMMDARMNPRFMGAAPPCPAWRR
jgi:hypothetical protein